MIFNRGGTRVMRGTYWNPVDGHKVDIKDEGVLPGDERTPYLKFPPGGLLLIAPVFGLMYVIFLPLFGIGTFVIVWMCAIVGTLAAATLTGIRICSGLVGRNISFGWSPAGSYLAGKRGKGKKEGKNEKGL